MSEIIANLHTNKGTIKVKLFADKAPITVANFVNLAQLGYFNHLKFHRVIKGFVIQGGCPLGTGYGGPGYRFEDEFDPSLRHNKAGILSMANAGPNTNGSQFFITHGPTPHLDDAHSVFGEVVSSEDLDVVNAVEQGDMIESVTLEGDIKTLLEQQKDKIHAWNKTLASEFPALKDQIAKVYG